MTAAIYELSYGTVLSYLSVLKRIRAKWEAPESNAFRWCASACAIGYLLALIPAASFVVVIHRRVCLEDSFLKVNLPGYNLYAQRVAAGFPFSRGF